LENFLSIVCEKDANTLQNINLQINSMKKEKNQTPQMTKLVAMNNMYVNKIQYLEIIKKQFMNIRAFIHNKVNSSISEV
jgi:hypothetical protein